ncbi:glycosyltransferase [Paenibacillus validus]|uniref:Glycosyltransferase n=1 Tax=Paenibacillus validus TaxID=44253 RepID=A0A7X2ZE97_9BACL|nr:MULTISPECIES: glycosyltransferase [Paenibacillus]MED4599894.1 glycosyltransferase [Paenibacillus validus]MED4608236.1 glycosyltransferase [Paenibacillus validus]MUG73281.1 glycosyltransferase [Paenibacillus validus]
MHKYRKLLILTASYGDGHIQVSNVLKHKFEQNGFQSVKLIDLFEAAHPLMNTITKFLYINSGALSAIGLDYYGWSYYLTKNLKQDSMLAKCLNVLGIQKLMKVILQEKPDVIVSTFPFGGISDQLKRRGMSILTFTILTDFVLHNRWLYSIPDRFYVATEDLRREMIERGIPGDIITVSGIPIREPFYETSRPREDGESEPSVLIMAGAYGVLRDLKKITGQLLSAAGVRIHVVCGKNDKLKNELQASFAADPRVRLYGFVDDIHKLMSRSSCIVTKAGGITLSEAIHINVPIIIFKPFPGQEKENASYLSDQGVALIANEISELTRQAKAILTDEKMANAMKNRARSLQAGYAANRIVEDVFHRLMVIERTRQGSSA